MTFAVGLDTSCNGAAERNCARRKQVAVTDSNVAAFLLRIVT